MVKEIGKGMEERKSTKKMVRCTGGKDEKDGYEM